VLQVHSAIAVTIAGGWALPFRRRVFDVWVWRTALVRRCASRSAESLSTDVYGPKAGEDAKRHDRYARNDR
jgi:hypothetical protein